MVSSFIAFLIPALLLLSSADASSLALTNARIYTVDESNPWAEAVLIDENGVLTAVGSTSYVMQLVVQDNATTIIDLEQRLVLPGFHDVHLHAVEAGINEQACYVPAETPVQDVVFYLDECGETFGSGEWIVGAGIDVGILLEEIEFGGAEYPITVLDRDYPDTPVLILDNLGHGAIANSVAMAAVGYDTLTGNPPGGILIRDGATNALTGIVLENAQQPLRDAAFPPTQANQDIAYDSLLYALELLVQNGITSVSDAGGFYRQAQTESWARAEAEGLLTVRASNALYVYPDTPLDEQLNDLTSRYSNDPNSLLRFNQAKIYVDGILSLLTSAVYEPYEPSLGLAVEDELGFEYFGDSTTLFQVSQTLSDLGFQLHFHVTGDRGAGLALDAIEQHANASSGPHRLTHCYLVDEADRSRFAELNAVADFQLAPSSVDTSYTDFMATLIGLTRASQLLPAVEIYNAGGLITLSSDYDADVLSPLVKIQTVLTRTSGQAFSDLETVLPFMTINSATLLNQDETTGSITVGKAADLVVLDKNIFEIPVEDIHTTRVLVTMLQGKVVHDPNGIMGETIGTNVTSGSFSHHERNMWLVTVGLLLVCASTLIR